MKKKILFRNKLKYSSIEFTQICSDGCIWIKSTGHYPITINELKRILNSYISYEDGKEDE